MNVLIQGIDIQLIPFTLINIRRTLLKCLAMQLSSVKSKSIFQSPRTTLLENLLVRISKVSPSPLIDFDTLGFIGFL